MSVAHSVMLERAAIVQWLRQHTCLEHLAALFEAGVHHRSADAQRAYCIANGIMRKGEPTPEPGSKR